MLANFLRVVMTNHDNFSAFIPQTTTVHSMDIRRLERQDIFDGAPKDEGGGGARKKEADGVNRRSVVFAWREDGHDIGVRSGEVEVGHVTGGEVEGGQVGADS